MNGALVHDPVNGVLERVFLEHLSRLHDPVNGTQECVFSELLPLPSVEQNRLKEGRCSQ